MLKSIPVALRFDLAAAMVAIMALQIQVCEAVEIEGFTEPNRSVNVATPEQGIVVAVPVQVGDFVNRGQVVAELDDQIHVILRDSALQRKNARGRLLSAEAEVRLRTKRLEKITELRSNGFGRKEELDRAITDLEIAESELQAVQEDLADKQLQFQKHQAELARRVIYSPLSGFVSARLKEPGEFVAPNEPNLVTIVELDPLLAKFSMKRSLARHVRVGELVDVMFEELGETVAGTVEQISPVVDAQSGTIKVKVRIENPDGRILSGERCAIDIQIRDEPSQQEPAAATKRIAQR